MTVAPITWLQHGKVTLALHRLRTVPGSGRSLLILHGLGEQAPTTIPPWCRSWTGSIAALDFTGHGQSTVPRSGGYIAEMLMGDADHAVSELGQVTVIGRGLGAYIALLIAGGRADSVYGAILCDGPGLAGGAVAPTSASYSDLPARSAPPDPYALLELSRDLRPADYATVYARLALEHSLSETPITVCAVIRPPWLSAVADEMGVIEASIDDALATYQADADAARPSAN